MYLCAMENCYVYIHKKADTKEIFYVGIGSQLKYKRAYQMYSTKRNSIWNRIVKKHGVLVEVINDNLTREQAVSIEIELIKKYGRIDLGTGVLCNMTNGGDGCNGIKNRVSGMKGKKMPIDSYNRTRKYLTGRILSEETKQKMSISRLGKKHSKEHIEKIKAGISNANYKGKIIINTKTKEEFNSISKAATFYGLSISSLNRKLNGKYKNDTDLAFK